MPTIRKRGPMQWQAIVKRRGIGFASKTFTTRKDAEDWAFVAQAAMVRGAYISRSDAEKTTLRELIKRYRRDVLPGLRGVGCASHLRRLDEKLGGFSLAGVTPAKVAAYRDERLKAGKSASTVKKELATLSVLFKLASREWGIGGLVNPVTGITRPVERNARNRRLEGDELPRLLAECSPPMALLVRFAIATAARLGELLAARWSDVDVRARVLTLRGIDGKGTKNGDAVREIPLSREALRVLIALKKLPRSLDGRLFHWWKASDSFNHTWRSACARAGITGLRFHDLRREAASQLFERGTLSETEVASITGHKSLAMLQRYTHLRAARLARKMG